jgi:pimeloyl-ACP methyl ester carboxylesterase
MYVNMARAWAAQGFEVLRMDFSGMGDSRLRNAGKENEVYASRFMAETRSAVDFLIGRGVTNVVLMGLCSGAYVAYHTATADPRVSGIVLINPLTFHWTEGDSLEVRMRESFGSTAQYKRRFFRYETWRRLVRGEIGVAAISAELARRVRRRATYEARAVIAKLTGDIAETTDIERGFRRMCTRGTSSLLVLGADDGSRDAIEEHLGKDAAGMRSVSGFRIEIWPGTDHTFTPLWAQRKLTQRIGDYLATFHESR